MLRRWAAFVEDRIFRKVGYGMRAAASWLLFPKNGLFRHSGVSLFTSLAMILAFVGPRVFNEMKVVWEMWRVPRPWPGSQPNLDYYLQYKLHTSRCQPG